MNSSRLVIRSHQWYKRSDATSGDTKWREKGPAETVQLYLLSRAVLADSLYRSLRIVVLDNRYLDGCNRRHDRRHKTVLTQPFIISEGAPLPFNSTDQSFATSSCNMSNHEHTSKDHNNSLTETSASGSSSSLPPLSDSLRKQLHPLSEPLAGSNSSNSDLEWNLIGNNISYTMSLFLSTSDNRFLIWQSLTFHLILPSPSRQVITLLPSSHLVSSAQANRPAPLAQLSPQSNQLLINPLDSNAAHHPCHHHRPIPLLHRQRLSRPPHRLLAETNSTSGLSTCLKLWAPSAGSLLRPWSQ